MNVVFSVCMPLLYVGGEPTVKVCCLASYNITKVGLVEYLCMVSVGNLMDYNVVLKLDQTLLFEP